MSETCAYPAISPHLRVNDGAAAIEFYKKAFGAEEVFRFNMPDSPLVGHAALSLLGMKIMLADDFPSCQGGKSLSPTGLGGTSVAIHLHLDGVEKLEALWARAVEAGCTVSFPLGDQFWGDRYGKLTDPFGHEWSMAATVATPSLAEMEAAMRAMMSAAPETAKV